LPSCVVVAQRTLDPLAQVRILARQPANITSSPQISFDFHKEGQNPLFFTSKNGDVIIINYTGLDTFTHVITSEELQNDTILPSSS
jgi:hypothetical protein